MPRKAGLWTMPAVEQPVAQAQPRPSAPEMPRSSKRIWVWIGTLLALAVVGSMAAVATGQFAPDTDAVPSLASIMLPAMTVANVAPAEQPAAVEPPAVATPAVTPTIPEQPTIATLQLPEQAPAKDAAAAKAPVHPARAHAAKRTAAASASAKHAHHHAAPASQAEVDAPAPAVPAPQRPQRPQAQADDSERPSALSH
jgi:hypothetical protein